VSDFLTRIAKLSPQRLALLANELNERLQAVESERSTPVAIVGMGCRYPGGANDPESFWALLHDGVDAIQEVPADRWDVEALYDPNPETPGRMATRWGGFIDRPDRFDPKFFGIAPAEAVTMDPQQRLLLETAWEALEDAGINPASLAGTAAGVFVGLCNSDYAFHALRVPREAITAHMASGLSHAVASGRISYLLGLQGPSATIDTSCSSSLMAVHLACQSLRRRESNLALAGGANVILNPEITMALSRSRMMAPDGRCKAFSDDANGFVRAEGSGMLVLKRLEDAVADRNRILAVIRGTAANQDGKSSGLTAPNGSSQETVLRAALGDAGMGPGDLQYIEGHGTGTGLGDPIEIGALAQVFAERPREAGPLWTGSVKSNVGHLESAAGVAGLMKLVLAIQHAEIPASLHVGQPNRRVEWETIPVRVASQKAPWPESNGPRAGGVSSFGFSGTNVHVIVQEAPPADEAEEESADRPRLFTLCAKTETALQPMAKRLANWLEAHPELPLAGVARTLMTGRAPFEHRLAVVARSSEEAVAQLRAFPDGDALPGKTVDQEPRIGLWFAADALCAFDGRALVARVPAFAEKLRACEAILSEEARISLTQWVESGSPAGVPAEMQPAFSLAVQMGFAWLLQSCGVETALAGGSGTGTIAAAWCAGVLGMEDAFRLALAVGRGDARAVEELSQTLPMEDPHRGWFAGEEKGLLDPWIRRALTTGAATRLEAQEEARAWVVVGEAKPEDEPRAAKIRLAGAEGNGVDGFVRAAAEMYMLGCAPDLSRLYGQAVARTVALPTYPFERERYWLEVEGTPSPKRSAIAEKSAEATAGPEHDWLYEVAWEPVSSDGDESGRMVSVMEKYVPAPTSALVLRLGEAGERVQALCASYALRSLTNSGMRPAPESLSLEGWCDRLQIAPARARIVDRLLGILAEEGVVTRIGDRFRFVEGSAPADPDAECAALAAQFPEIETELRILKRCADQTPAVLRGQCDPMQLVFAAGSVNEAEQIYEKSPVCRHFNQMAQEMIGRAVSGIEGRTARILEIGAGTGATTAAVLPALAGKDVTYTFTDLSPVFLAKARQKFRAYADVDYRLLNVERDPTEQGFENGSLDIVLAANVLHATANLRATVAHARQLLRPGGMLMLIEGTRPDRWLDLTFGMTDGWWRFTDRGLRPHHPLVSCETWQELFREQGLSASRAIRYTDHGGTPSQQVLLAACADGPEIAAPAGEQSRRRWVILGDRSGVGAALERILRSRSEECERVEWDGETTDWERALDSIGARSPDEALQIVYPGGLDAKDAQQGMDLCAQVPVRLIQKLAAGKQAGKLWLVTRGAQSAGGVAAAENALQAMTWGIGRVLGLEHPELLGRLIDLDPKSGTEESAQMLLREMTLADAEDQVAFRRGERLAPRLRSLAPAALGQPRETLRRDGSYLVTGAFGAVGRRVTRWLAESGAGHLVLVSRRGADRDGDPAAQERARFVEELERLGAGVTVVAGDVASPATVEKIFCLFGGACPPLRGVLHLATAQKMRKLVELSRTELDEVLLPKVMGGWLLAKALEGHSPDFFVNFSSTTALLGARNMAAYAAANHFLDSFAAGQPEGRRMISVNWGAWRTSAESEQLRSMGLVPMAAAEALAWLPRVLGSARSGAVIADVDWKTVKALYESRRSRPMLSEVGTGPDCAADGPGRGTSDGETKVSASSIAELVLAEAARVLGFRGGEQPAVDVALTDLGLDSLMAVDLRNRLQAAMGRELPSTIVFDYPTVAQLTSVLETMAWAAARDPSQNESTEQDEVLI
jgi:acyl transferase domain-containing protein/SAM-dependent methyltransferase/NAD(P)-dependent dehydrogenase (short-subunit alcohol dehydrogenase family)/acyl carrier protein